MECAEAGDHYETPYIHPHPPRLILAKQIYTVSATLVLDSSVFLRV